MKLFSAIRFGFILSLFSISLFSCQKEGDAPPPKWSGVYDTTPSVSGSMTCKVDANQWTAAANMANASIYNDISNVTGVNSGSSTITFTVNEAITLNGTYDLGFNTGNFAAYTSSSASSSAWISHLNASSGGTLFITALDTENELVSGTFDFVAIRPTDNNYKYITEGQFTNLSYSTSATGPTNNSFTVDIDEEPFVPAAINGIIMDSKIRIVASDAQGVESVSLSVPEDIEPGTYEIGSAFSDYSGMYNQDASTFTTSESGTLTITTHDIGSSFIEGSFNFTSTGLLLPDYTSISFELTNGEFSVNY